MYKTWMSIVIAIFMVAIVVLPASAQAEEDEDIDAEWSASIFQPDKYEAEMVVKLTIEGEEFSSNGFVPSCEYFSLGEYSTIPIFTEEWTYILEIYVEEQEYLLLKLVYIQIDKEGQVGTTQKIANPFLGKCVNSTAPKTSFAINYSPVDENSPDYDYFRNQYIAEAIINGVVYDFGGSPDPDSISKYGIECSKEMEYEFLQ